MLKVNNTARKAHKIINDHVCKIDHNIINGVAQEESTPHLKPTSGSTNPHSVRDFP